MIDGDLRQQRPVLIQSRVKVRTPPRLGNLAEVEVHIRMELSETTNKSPRSHNEHARIPQISRFNVGASGLLIGLFDERTDDSPVFWLVLIERISRSNVPVSC